MHNTKNANKLYYEAYDNMLPSDLNQEFMKWHYQLGQMSYKKMKMWLVLGIWSKKLKEYNPPTCATYKYGSMTKRPWRSKPSKLPKDKSIIIVRPGQCISVDQMEIREEGFIA